MEKQTQEKNEFIENNTDFQSEINQNYDYATSDSPIISDCNAQEDCNLNQNNSNNADGDMCQNNSDSADGDMCQNNSDSADGDMCQNNVETIKEDETESNVVLSEDNVVTSEQQENLQEIEDKNCSINRKQDEMIKNIMTYSCIPFILAAIILSIFNMNKMRYPYSFLLLGLGILDISICSFIRSKKLTLNCSCKKCLKQSKSAFKLALFLALTAVALFITFICLMVL